MSNEKTKTRTVKRLEAVEVEVFECPFCEQEHEKEEMMEIGIDRRETTNNNTGFHSSDQLCVACAESIFDYERPSSSYNWTYVPTAMRGWTWMEILAVGAVVAITGAVLWGLFTAMGYFANGMADMVNSALSQTTPAGESAPEVTPAPFLILAVMLIVGSAVHAIKDSDQL